MRSWEFISKRRKISLEHFLGGVETLEGALEKFKSFDCEPPPGEVLESFFQKGGKASTPQPPLVEEKKHESPKQVKKANKKYDDIVIIGTEQTSSDD